jgi:hypothetical protein
VGPDPRKTVESPDHSQYSLFIKSLNGIDCAIFESSNVEPARRRVIVYRDNRPQNNLAGTVIGDISPAISVNHCRGE